MALASFRSALKSRRFAWLLAFVLWLPAAQWASATHTLLHLNASLGGERDPGAPPAAVCDLCVVAASVGSGGAAPHIAATAVVVAPPLGPAFFAPAAPALRPSLPYRSRAPPLPHA